MNKFYIILTVSCLFVLFGFKDNEKLLTEDINSEKRLVLTPSPASSFINVNVNGIQTGIGKDSSFLAFNVRILNVNKVMVFSATKSSSPFNIYIGGLPNGQYILVLKTNEIEIQGSFEVKH